MAEAQTVKDLIADSRSEDGPFHRVDSWPDPGKGPLWSQKSDAVKAIQYVLEHGREGVTDHYWCDYITFGLDHINIWINGTHLTLHATRPTIQRPVPTPIHQLHSENPDPPQ